MNKTTVGIIFTVLILLPALPLLLTWRQIVSRRDALAVSSAVTVKTPLLVTTGSCLLFLLTLFLEPATGVRYSDAKFEMIVTAFGLSLSMAVLSLAGKSPFRRLLAITATAVSLAWFYLWAMSAVV
jgi:hypothetical protein